ncbi:Patched domain-containing protein 3 [Halocaridina rubra]|uniref:Patched domain-containing protein 3 n=1 Tax=Halocaridina rubra TaxID=373956 RepID=A0AAN8ZRF1_HALRR
MAAKVKSRNILAKLSLGVITGLESFCHVYGTAVAKRPTIFIVVCMVITGLCSIGLMKFTMEERPFKLWIPQDSDFIKVMEWQKENFPVEFRIHIAIYEAENVLDKSVLLEMLRVHEAVANASTNNATWNSVCAKIPTITGSWFGRRKRSIYQDITLGFSSSLPELQREKRQNDDTDWSIVLDRDTYCGFYEKIAQECMEHSILEVWGYDREYINSLTSEEIIDDVNLEEKSAVFGFLTNFSQFLGKIQRDADGKIIKAGASRQLWITHINLTSIELGDYVDDTGTGMEVDATSFHWEKELIKAVLDENERPYDISLYLMASSSFGMISRDTIMGDVTYLAVGFGIMCLYVQIMLGKFNLVETRPLLSLMGLGCVGMSIFMSYGICSAFGVPFGPVNNVLPFLLMGLGVDDMFVIMQAWNNLSPHEKKMKLAERIGITLKHAGVSITVTSVTNFSAFAIGSGTVLPALRSFCIFASVGIATVYFFQATFFVAWFSLDQRRLEERRFGFFWLKTVSESWTPNECSQRDLCQTFFSDVYAKYLFKLPVKVLVLLFTAGLVAVSGWGLSNLRQEFNPIWFLPHSSYLYKFFMKQELYYPTLGETGTIYFGEMNYFEELPKIEVLINKMEASDSISEVDSWYSQYKYYWEKQDIPVIEPDENEERFLEKLGIFLHSPSGSRYRVRNFRFDGVLNCTDPAPPILSSSIEYKHCLFSDSREQINAMVGLKDIISGMNFAGEVYSWARAYSGWETDMVIKQELYMNMGLAMLVVFLVTLLLIANIATSLMVLFCVVLTLVDVGALMHWWGLTIDTVSCIGLVLAIGLCVDYAAHIGHTFMTKHGTREERARMTVATIGPAILHGGFSTFLAFIFLANSDSHVFVTFFKIFFAVVMYGLLHGLVFLPVLLSMLGPAPYPLSLDEPHPKEVEEMCPNPPAKSSPVPATPEIEEGDNELSEKDTLNSIRNKDTNGCAENGKSEFVSVLLDSPNHCGDTELAKL